MQDQEIVKSLAAALYYSVKPWQDSLPFNQESRGIRENYMRLASTALDFLSMNGYIKPVAVENNSIDRKYNYPSTVYDSKMRPWDLTNGKYVRRDGGVICLTLGELEYRHGISSAV